MPFGGKVRLGLEAAVYAGVESAGADPRHAQRSVLAWATLTRAKRDVVIETVGERDAILYEVEYQLAAGDAPWLTAQGRRSLGTLLDRLREVV